MPSFNAKDALEPLEYDFRPYSEEQGEVAEPTDTQVAEFYASLSSNLKNALGEARVEGFDLEQPADIGRLFVSLTAEEHQRIYDAVLDCHASVCGGSPSRDAMAALPFRLRQAWYGALQGWLRPEASRPATDS